jgi:hypothetical protein
MLMALSLGCGGGNEEKQPLTVDAAPQVESEVHPPKLSAEFSSPESVLYDEEQDVYFVSNINGGPIDADDNGYISRVSAVDGKAESRWIDGAAEKVTLDAPKGMAIVGEDLWVADIHVLRRFDRRSGAPRGEVEIPGSSFLNDVAAPFDGPVYVSDTGITLEGSEPRPTGTDALYRVSLGGEVEKVIAGKDLQQPNGLLSYADELWGVTYAGHELFQIIEGKRVVVGTLPGSGLDGLLELPDRTFLISSWEASGIYRGPAAGPFELVIRDIPFPADLGYDRKRRLLLIPHLMNNEVSVHALAVDVTSR